MKETLSFEKKEQQPFILSHLPLIKEQTPDGKMHLQLEQFISPQSTKDILFFHPGALHLGEKGKPMQVSRHITIVADPITGNKVPFDVITKNCQLQTPHTDITVDTDPEYSRVFDEEKRDFWEKFLSNPHPEKMIALRTAIRLTPDIDYTPDMQPEAQVIKRCTDKLVDFLKPGEKLTDVSFENVQTKEKKPIYQSERYTIYQGKTIYNRKWRQDAPMYWYPVQVHDKESKEKYIEIISGRPLEALRKNLGSSITIGTESMCPCITTGQKGCDCRMQLEDRIKKVIAQDNGIIFYKPLEPAKGLGEVYSDSEETIRAWMNGTLHTGEVPEESDLVIREKLLGSKPTDLRSFNDSPHLLYELIDGDSFAPFDLPKVFLMTDNKRKENLFKEVFPKVSRVATEVEKNQQYQSLGRRYAAYKNDPADYYRASFL